MNNLNNMQNSNMNNHSYDQKKNNGKGIFYGVIAVATLIVAIIGATFAYFTASANSSEGALSAVAAHVEVNYSEGRQLKATNLIPSSASVVKAAYARPTAYAKNIAAGCTLNQDANEADPESTTSAANWTCPDSISASSTGDVGTKCVDDNGYYVCAVYQFSVTNTSNVKQALQAYLSINSNSFVTADAASVAAGKYTIGMDGASALKFMTVRSDSLIDVTAISSASDPTTCDVSTLTGMNATNPSTKFCAAGGTDDADKTTFTDTSGTYYYFNTTALRQSLQAADTTQTVFSGEVLPSISANNLTSSNQILYMHTASDTSNQITTVGPADAPITLSEVWADTNGNSYDSEAACNAGVGTAYGVTCSRVYLSTNTAANGTDDVVLGAYGQVTRTFYVVAWLEENNPDNTYAYAENTAAENMAEGRAAGDKVDQDLDQDKSFAATINVTSGTLGSAGITGTIAGA